MVSIQPEPQDNTRVNQQKNLDLTKMGGSKEVIKIVPPGKQIYGEQIHPVFPETQIGAYPQSLP